MCTILNLQEKNEALRQLPPGNVKSAWKTPPLSPSVRSTAQSSRVRHCLLKSFLEIEYLLPNILL